MSKQATLETARPTVQRLGMGGRVKSEFVQPVYTYKGKLVVHASGKLREVTITGPNTATVDLLAQPALDFSDDKPKRSELSGYLAQVGAKIFAPAKADKPKASSKPAKAAKPQAAATAKPSAPSLEDLVAAIMGSAAPMEQKVEAISALRG